LPELCPVNNLYRFKNEDEYKAGTTTGNGGLDFLDFKMDISKKGKNEIVFSVGGEVK